MTNNGTSSTTRHSGGLAHVLGALYGQPWAIMPAHLEAIIGIVEGHLAGLAVDFDAVAAKIGKPLDNSPEASYVQNREGTAVLSIEGPLVRHAGLFSRVSGLTSVQHLALDFQSALDDPAVARILLNVNSPGGEVDGINEFADMIRAGSERKPVTAYVGGLAGSAAYWLASAAQKIVANESAQLGSIGVIASILDARGAQERQGVKRHEIISSQSPRKAMDPATEGGRAQIQSMVDSLADLFIEKVAAFRDTTTAKVMRDFGQGGMMSARAAITMGLADSLGSYEGLLATMGTDAAPARITVAAAAPAAQLDEEMDDPECDCPPGTPPGECDCQDNEEEEATMERQRIAAILNCEEARGREQTAQALALETNLTPEEARKVLLATPVAQRENPLERRMAQVPNPMVGTPAGDGPPADSAQAEAARILAFLPDHLKVKSAQRTSN